MESVKVNGIEFSSIEDYELKDLIERLYNDDYFNNALLSLPSESICRRVTDFVSEIVVKYSIATGDLSLSYIKPMVDGVIKTIQERKKYTNSDEQNIDILENSAYPYMVEYWKDKLNRHDDSLQTMIDVCSAISIQSKNNKFLTHSFNGALEDKVKEEGLNINDEMFSEVYSSLSNVLDTPYEKGKLFFCELSFATYGYAHKSPERLWMTISQGINKKEDETLKEYGYRCIKKNFSEADKEIMQGFKDMVDFYTSSSKSCIAIRKKKITIDERMVEETINNITKLTKMGMSSALTLKSALPKELREKYNEVAKNKDSTIEDWDNLLNKISSTSEKLKDIVDGYKKSTYVNLIARWGLKNYMYYNADGYEVEGGIMNKEDFVLAIVNDPVRTYVLNKRENIKVNK